MIKSVKWLYLANSIKMIINMKEYAEFHLQMVAYLRDNWKIRKVMVLEDIFKMMAVTILEKWRMGYYTMDMEKCVFLMGEFKKDYSKNH